MLFACGQTEAQIVVLAFWAVVVPKRHPTVLRIVVPTTSTKHAVRACRRPRRVSLTTATVIAVPVRTPLPNIAAHIIYSNFIWCLCPNRFGTRIISCVIVPSNIINTVATAVFVAPTLIPASCRILPFSLCRQSEVLASLLV